MIKFLFERGLYNVTGTEIIAQILGVFAIILGFLSYQTKSSKSVLALQSLTTVTFTVHYLLLGAYSGMVMNAVGIIRNFFYYNSEKKFFSWKGWSIIFAIVSGTLGVLAWEAWYSVFVVAGIVINTVCMSFGYLQLLRKSILVSSPMTLLYNVLMLSVGGAINEFSAIVASVIGIIRYNRSKAKEEK